MLPPQPSAECSHGKKARWPFSRAPENLDCGIVQSTAEGYFRMSKPLTNFLRACICTRVHVVLTMLKVLDASLKYAVMYHLRYAVGKILRIAIHSNILAPRTDVRQ